MLSFLKRGPRVLVLDDDTAMQRLLSTILGRQGYRLDIVSGGSQAIEKIGRTAYDVLLLDLMTPTDGGLTVIRHLKETKPDMLRRVVLLTASPESILKNVAHEVFGVVRKPFQPEELLGTLARALGKA